MIDAISRHSPVQCWHSTSKWQPHAVLDHNTSTTPTMAFAQFIQILLLHPLRQQAHRSRRSQFLSVQLLLLALQN